jgi:hypothetical protein
MKSTCTKWKKLLPEAALTGIAKNELRDHLLRCPDCAAELEALGIRRERMDALLPQLTRNAEPSPDLYARIMAAAEASVMRRHGGLARSWVLAATAAILIVAMMLAAGRIRKAAVQEAELRGAQSLAKWRSPTDVFLRTPGREFLTNTFRLGESVVSISVNAERRENR